MPTDDLSISSSQNPSVVTESATNHSDMEVEPLPESNEESLEKKISRITVKLSQMEGIDYGFLKHVEDTVNILHFISTTENTQSKQARVEQELIDLVRSLGQHPEREIESGHLLPKALMLVLMIEPERLRPSSGLYNDLSPEARTFVMWLGLDSRNDRTQMAPLYAEWPKAVGEEEIAIFPLLNEADLIALERMLSEVENPVRLTNSLGNLTLAQGDDATLTRLINISRNHTTLASEHAANLVKFARAATPGMLKQIEWELLSYQNFSITDNGSFSLCMDWLNTLEGENRQAFFSEFLGRLCPKSANGVRSTLLPNHQIALAKNWDHFSLSEREAVIRFVEKLNPLDQKKPSEEDSGLADELATYLTTLLTLYHAEVVSFGFDAGYIGSFGEQISRVIEASSVTNLTAFRDQFSELKTVVDQTGRSDLSRLSKSLSRALDAVLQEQNAMRARTDAAVNLLQLYLETVLSDKGGSLLNNN